MTRHRTQQNSLLDVLIHLLLVLLLIFNIKLLQIRLFLAALHAVN